MSIELALKYAERSTINRHRTGAVITDSSGRPLSYGWSHMSDIGLKRLYSFHAELHALWRLGKPLRPARHIYIATFSRAGNVCSGRPCVTCAIALVKLGIELATYSIRPHAWTTIYLPEELDDLKRYSVPGR